MRRRWLAGLLLALATASPTAALAAGKPTPTPVPTQPVVRATSTTVPATPTSVPASPTSVPATPTTVAATPTAVPATLSTVPEQPAPEAETPPNPAPPAPAETPAPTPAPTEAAIPDDAFNLWHGLVRAGGAYRRGAPSGSAEILEELDAGTPIRVDAWVPGSMLYPDVITWAQVDPEDGGGYIFGGSLEGVLPPAAPPAPEAMQNFANWIDVNLTLNVVTAYQDGQPIKAMLTSPGRPGHETDTGLFSVRTKITSQTMSGPGYSVPNVPDVQYFFGGEALHGRYWTLPDDMALSSADIDENGLLLAQDDPPVADDGPNLGVAFGVPSSHGCLGLQLSDALWLYSTTHVGTPVDVHY